MNVFSERDWLLNDTASLLASHLPKTGDYSTCVPSLTVYRRDLSEHALNCVYTPQIIVVVLGQKSAQVGGRKVVCEAGEYLLTCVDMPASERVVAATDGKPYFSMQITLDKDVLDQLLLETESVCVPKTAQTAVCVAKANTRMWRIFHSLAELLTTPEDALLLAPLYIKELHYHLLQGPLGWQLRQVYLPGTPSRHIAWVIAWIRENFTAPLKIAELARLANLSESMLFRQFKKVTSLTPLQFQKQLRLQEAHRLMVVERLDANSASLSVGYTSPHQFSREYKRFFGAPPLRDANRWRAQS
ncbi:MAG: AraC family transcriptional regulator [Desulfovibrionaceae bacterium]|nr:AraC family transcriptional regulator [Desulfovibrionaceae bacterium]